MIYALVPARGGSRGIPMKNIRVIGGKPLIWWVLNAAEASIIDKVFVATDHADIRSTVMSFGFKKVNVIGRSDVSATDDAPTEVVMEEFCRKYRFKDLVLLQPTSPLLSWCDINMAISIYMTGGYDSILPAVEHKKFLWKEYNGDFFPVNYDPRRRPMRQQFDGFLAENGYIYIMNRVAFLKHKCRLFGRIGVAMFGEETLIEPDDECGWCIIEKLLK